VPQEAEVHDEQSDEFLVAVAALIDARDPEALRREWATANPTRCVDAASHFEAVAMHVWSRVPCLVQRLANLVEWQTESEP
jgi:hypothetical protein